MVINAINGTIRHHQFKQIDWIFLSFSSTRNHIHTMANASFCSKNNKTIYCFAREKKTIPE